ncbi:protein rep [Brachybacterium paraconglomeratum]|uniref:protein rep n=1 Tax=Brachybacterium paraconglomeratum TaxID=173362 RepID=UPI003FD2964D
MIRHARTAAGKSAVAEDVLDQQTGELRRPRAGDEQWVRPDRLARCSWRVGEVGVHADGHLAHFSGTERCGSIWACPVCSAVIRSERAREIQHAVAEHTAQGGALLLVTLTMRHHKRQPLADTLDGLLKSWQKILRGKAWTTTKDRYGISGYLRSVEVTYGENGWHPHIHAVLFLDDQISEAAAETLGDELHGRWARYVMASTGKMPDRKHGVDVQRVSDDGKVVASYLAKMQDDHAHTWDVGAELARSDVKTARGSRSLVPFELLDVAADHLSADEKRALWVEYATATKGRRAITWSKGLKARYEVQERTDDQIIEDTERAPLRYVADGPAYDALRRRDPLRLALVLEAAEAENWEQVARLLPGELLRIDIGPRVPPDSVAGSAFPRAG